MQDIPNYKDFKVITPVLKGYSTDKKYYIETGHGKKLLLRISDISEFDKKKREYAAIKEIAALNIITSKPMDFGICDQGKSVYILLTWIEGDDVREILTSLTAVKQYSLGIKAGEVLIITLKYICFYPMRAVFAPPRCLISLIFRHAG